MAEKRERDSSEAIRKHLMQYGVNKENPAYLVRGAELVCSQGTNKRMMNLNKCHGVYIKEHAVVHELDCIQGDEENITWFGVCNPGEGLETDDIELIGDNGEKCHGKKCKPYLIGTWYESFEGTRIVDNGDKKQEDGEEPEGCNTITTDSFLVCKYGGIITPVNSGQDREVSADEFDYETEEEREAALARVQEPCEEEIDREDGCGDLLHAKLSEDDEWSRHGSEFEKSVNYVNTYSDFLVEFVKQKEGLYLTVYNNGQTVGYGFDFRKRKDIEINWNEDGISITGEEAKRLLRIILDESMVQLNNYLKQKGLQVDENTFDALTDLYYNRNDNALTKEVVDAMADRDDQRVLELLADFDYRYAYKYKYYYIEDEEQRAAAAQAYVDRNPGLKTRREEEYLLYKGELDIKNE